MNIGAMRERIRLQAPVQSNQQADAWGLSDAYVPICEVWAEVRSLSAQRRYINLTGEFVVRYSIKMRWRGDVDLLTRIVWNGRYLFINDIIADEVDGDMTLMCYERATR